MKSLLGLLALGLVPISGALAQIIDTGNPDLRAEIVEVDEIEGDGSKLQSANFKVNVRTVRLNLLPHVSSSVSSSSCKTGR